MDIFELLKKYVRIDTNSVDKKNFQEMAELIKQDAESFGLKAKIIEEKVKDSIIPHVIITLPNPPKNSKTVVFSAHYDVVPPGPLDLWKYDPFGAVEKGNKIYGRGAADDKSGVVAGLFAMKEVLESEEKPKINPVLAIAGGEETGEGAGFFKSLNGDLAVILDTGPECLSIGASGAVILKVIVGGKQAHSAYPFLGENAIYNAIDVLKWLKEYGKWTTFNIKSKYDAPVYYDKLPARLNATMVKAGEAVNIIPEKVEIIVDRRTIPEEDAYQVGLEIKKKLEKYGKRKAIPIKVEILKHFNAWVTKDEVLVNKVKTILEDTIKDEMKVCVELGGTDGMFLIDRMPVIQYGALRAECNIHGINEFVYKDDVILVKDFVKNLILNLSF